MSLIFARMKKIQSKMKWLEWPQHFSNYKSMGIFPDTQGRGNTAVCDWIWPNLELIQALVVFLNICKNEEDPIKNEGARVATRLYVDFSDAQGRIIL